MRQALPCCFSNRVIAATVAVATVLLWLQWTALPGNRCHVWTSMAYGMSCQPH